MEINQTSTINEVIQALYGTWDLSKQTNQDVTWKVLENGNLRIFKTLAKGDSIPLPDKFIKTRNEITPYFKFSKDGIEGGIITLQDTALKLDSDENKLIMILQF